MTVIAKIPMSPDSFRLSVANMKAVILATVENGQGSVTFGDLAPIEGFLGGVLGFGHGGFNNWFYQKLTAVACAAMCELVQEGELFIVPTMPEDYASDPHKPKAPIRRGLAPAGRPVWIPSRIESKHECKRKGACMAQRIKVGDEALGQCLHFEATMPLIQLAINDLNARHRDTFFEEAAKRRGTQRNYDLFYTIGSAAVEIFDKEEFRTHLLAVTKVNPQILTEAEIDVMLANPMLDSKHFEKLNDDILKANNGEEYGVTDYRVITDSGAPIAIRRLRMNQSAVEKMVADFLDTMDGPGDNNK